MEIMRGGGESNPTRKSMVAPPGYMLTEVHIIRPGHTFSYEGERLRAVQLNPRLSRIIVISLTPDELYRYESFVLGPDTNVLLGFNPKYHIENRPNLPGMYIFLRRGPYVHLVG